MVALSPARANLDLSCLLEARRGVDIAATSHIPLPCRMTLLLV